MKRKSFATFSLTLQLSLSLAWKSLAVWEHFWDLWNSRFSVENVVILDFRFISRDKSTSLVPFKSQRSIEWELQNGESCLVECIRSVRIVRYSKALLTLRWLDETMACTVSRQSFTWNPYLLYTPAIERENIELPRRQWTEVLRNYPNFHETRVKSIQRSTWIIRRIDSTRFFLIFSVLFNQHR